MLCRRQEEEPDNGPISKMSMYFFSPPLLLYVNPSLLSNSPVVVDPVVGARRFDYRHVSRGVMKQCESQRWMRSYSQTWWDIGEKIGVWDAGMFPFTLQVLQTRITALHSHLSANLSFIWAFWFFFFPLFILTLLRLMPYVFQKRSEIETVWCCRDFWLFLPISQMLVLSCKMFV